LKRFQCSPFIPNSQAYAVVRKASTHLVLVGRVRFPLLYYGLLRTLSILSHIRVMKALLWASVIIAAILLLQPALDENYGQCKKKAYKWAASTAGTKANCILFGREANNKAKF